MIKNYFKTAFRNLRKNKWYSAINIFGLTVGLSACLLIGIYISQELSYDTFHTHANRIVRATMEYSHAGTVSAVATTGTKPGPEFKRDFPLIERYVRTYLGHNTVKGGDKIFEEPRILYADTPFFQIFSFHILEGDAATALDAPDKIVVTRSMAKKYFGNADPLNRILTSGGRDFRISAVCQDVPPNSQIKFDFVTSFLNLGNGVSSETWWTANWITYFLVGSEKDIPRLQQQIRHFMNTPVVKAEAGLTGTDYLTYHLEPLTRVHLHSSLSGFEPNGSMTDIYMLALVALLILIIACANYTNLATAQSAGRGGEIGMRKVMGASRKQIFFQFISESSLIALAAAVLAFVLSIAVIGYFNKVTGKHFSSAVLVQPVPVIALIFFTVVVGFFSGLYPALVLSGAGVLNVLKKGFSFTGGRQVLRKTLIVAQFGISIFLIIYTVIILQQMHFMQTKDLGYNKDHIVVLPIGGNMLKNFENLKQAFAGVPGVQGVTASYETPEYVQWGDGITATDEKGEHEISVNAMPVDLDFIHTLGMQLVAGRDFRKSDFALMDTSDNSAHYRLPYIINETLARKIGWTPERSIGRTVSKGVDGPVVGVVKDFNFSSLRDPIGPLLIFLGRGYSRDFMIRLNGENITHTISGLQAVWKQRIPDRPFTYHFLDEDYNRLYVAEKRSSVLFGVAAAIAIILACLGLFGLAAFTTVQRTKEIGIRRVLGAGVSSITLLIAGNFLELIGIAVLIAVPVSWWAAGKWLQDFSFRIPIHVYVFVATAFVTALIALCTVGYHSVKAALSNPVESLRSE
jgi:putative ABC transport system permease protein